jgi:IclR family pca regulon transcriptional regulator
LSTSERNGEHVQALERGLAVMLAFSQEPPALRISDVAKKTNLPRPTARRLLHTLEHLGYVTRAGEHFSLGPRALNLGYAFLSSVPLRDLAIPHMVTLVAQVRESSVLSLLDDVDVVEVANVPVERTPTVAMTVGSRFPAHVTPAGRLLIGNLPREERASLLDRIEPIRPLTPRTIVDRTRLEEVLDQARDQGWAMVDQELEEGIRSMAVPLRGANHRVVATVSVWSYSSRVSMKRFRSEILPHLRETAAHISDALIGQRR